MIWLLAVGVGQAQECPEMDIDQQAERAVVALTDADFKLAGRLADDGLSALSCAKRVVDGEDLATLWQVKGAVAVYTGQTTQGEQWMAQAAAVNPYWFNERLGAPVQEVWTAQVEALANPANLTVWPLPDGSTLYVDGRPQQQAKLELFAGKHLVQVAEGAEVLYAEEVTLSASETSRVETGLAEPTLDAPPRWPWLVAGGAGLAGAGVSYGIAYGLNDDMVAAADAADPDRLAGLRQQQVTWGYIAAPAFAVVGLGTASYGLVRRQRAIEKMEAERTE